MGLKVLMIQKLEKNKRRMARKLLMNLKLLKIVRIHFNNGAKVDHNISQK